jgi:hypothetical protein
VRKLTLASLALVALIAASVAVAHGGDGTKSAKAVTGTFTATTVVKNNTRTCTSSDGKAISVTEGQYTGTATGDPDLTGNATVNLHALINTTDNIGAVSGTIKIDTAASGDRNTVAHFEGVYDKGTIAGLAEGRTATDGVGLLANLSAGFTPTGGLTAGKFGGTAGGSAAEFGPGKCEEAKPERSAAAGTVTAVSSSSITVAGLTCAVPSSLATKVAAIKVNDRAAINCEVQNGTPTLVSVDTGEHAKLRR